MVTGVRSSGKRTAKRSPPRGEDLRRLLASLRDVMAGSGPVQARLDKIVQLIAAEMGADVCSCYVMRAGEVLELFATVGLNPAAVHRTRLQVGEGVVGEVAFRARPLALADAQTWPGFAWRPETGEEPFHAMLGVPVLRGGRVQGVLTVQGREKRNYVAEEIEALQTVAMVVAELIAGGELVPKGEVVADSGSDLTPSRLQGTGLHRGVAVGTAILHHPRLAIRQTVSDNPRRERQRLKQALDRLRLSLDHLYGKFLQKGDREHLDILETHRMFLADRGWLARIHEAIGTGLTAGAAVQKVQDDMQARISGEDHAWMKERLADLDTLTTRLLQYLEGGPAGPGKALLPADTILVARTIGPAELLEYDLSRLRALVLEGISPNSHVAIIARAMDIPVVGDCTDVMGHIEPMDPLVVDGENGQVFIRPPEDILTWARQIIEQKAVRRKVWDFSRDLPPVTRDGIRVSLNLNCGLLMDLDHLDETGADGVGLYRTEIPFMVQSEYPDVTHQTELYTRVLDKAGARPVVFRTLDAGGDKPLPSFPAPHEDNPALGWRGLRIGLDRPHMLRRQIRALLRASRGRTLHLMFPMVSEVAELDQARALVDLERRRAGEREGGTMPDVRVGVMLEVPALLWQLDALLPRVDFISVGSNDLMQYMYACDRAHPFMAHRYDPLSPGFLGMLRALVQAGTRAGKEISVCGEMAGKPLDAMALLCLGVRSLSMASTSAGPVKAMLRSLDVGKTAAYLDTLMSGPGHSLREQLRQYALDHGVVL
ncbi:MAG: phosphoenolpyruvate--protein phosphotransferase [Pseudomonadota bacterium]|nr:phosphoenolpyruvate--protein phosphotransferase [Pseudomonadota bacterium]